ncbi:MULTISPECIES: hypothetical protein [Pseudomonas]|uniref:hypothetical protein n=1 Tax=Pseudomonas TaxID=286 RepID=UPI0007074D98|nr:MULTISPECIES: hypothetical protein [Pseudomonas]EKX2115217.1 hypothetical protein [Pseudomonas aeruginosa]KAF0592015.1 hypothetical protein PAPB9_05069 [Pseudomonas aeruginosa]KQK62698.1 hypothetical protein AOX61_30100 [Pseudomonas aeruginosa]KQK64445.1 hypothetical protein AOX62_25690 [Pseudomonas aeruginosa]MBG5708018.1 hypothetical protein [Pseudomonas aeruginosa]
MFKKAVAMMALPVALGITFHAQAAGLSTKADPVALEVCTASLGVLSGNRALVRYIRAKTPHWLIMEAVSASRGKVQSWECLHDAPEKKVTFRNPYSQETDPVFATYSDAPTGPAYMIRDAVGNWGIYESPGIVADLGPFSYTDPAQQRCQALAAKKFGVPAFTVEIGKRDEELSDSMATYRLKGRVLLRTCSGLLNGL